MGSRQPATIQEIEQLFTKLKLPSHWCDPLTQRVTPRGMLEMRLGYGQPLPTKIPGVEVTPPHDFKIVAVEEVEDGYVVFGIQKGKPVTMTDGKDLFPSDKLISKIKLLVA